MDGQAIHSLLEKVFSLEGVGECIFFVCSDHEMVKFRILREENKIKSRITALDIWRQDLGLLGIIPWDTALERRGVHDS